MRPSFDHIWTQVATVIAQRGTCPRLQVGAVIVSGNGKIVSTGYNGSPSWLEHCEDVGCAIEPETGRCKRTVHAEANALLQAGSRAKGGTLYSTHQPCMECSNLIINAGIRRIVFVHGYTSQDKVLQKTTLENYKRSCISLEQISEGEE